VFQLINFDDELSLGLKSRSSELYERFQNAKLADKRYR